jgi:tungstate transport system substrate-binding protein
MGTKILIMIAVAVLTASIVFSTSTIPTSTTRSRLVIATTTSTVDSGLLDYLKPYFDKRFDANMTWLYLGTGQAIAVASRGDADILLVHDRAREDAFVASGNGTHRATVMYNDFVIIGPVNDPANVRGAGGAVEAFKRIAEAGESGKACFVSRDDNSGTHAREMKIWSAVGLDPRGRGWYMEAGQGMSPTIRVSSEKQAYTLSDRGTWVKLKSTLGEALRLQILFEGDKMLLNPYGLILLNPLKYPKINSKLAEKFFLFMVSKEGQRLIESYRVAGEQIFFPAFGKAEEIGLPSEEEEVRFWVKRLSGSGLEPPPWVKQR